MHSVAWLCPDGTRISALCSTDAIATKTRQVLDRKYFTLPSMLSVAFHAETLAYRISRTRFEFGAVAFEQMMFAEIIQYGMHTLPFCLVSSDVINAIYLLLYTLCFE